MTRWLPRSLWLLAWSLWACLGVGLHRELPRDLGTRIATLPVEDLEYCLGFIADGGEVVTVTRPADGNPQARVWDARSGALLRHFPLAKPLIADWAQALYEHESLLVAETRPEIVGRPKPKGPSVLDLHSGSWLDLPVDHGASCDFLGDEPWGLFWLRSPNGLCRVQVLDLRSGGILFSWSNQTASRGGSSPLTRPILYSRPAFVGDLQLVLPIRQYTSENVAEDRLEVWPVPGAVPLKVIRGVSVGLSLDDSRSGRIMWLVLSEPSVGADVFDLNAERIVFSHPPGRTNAKIQIESPYRVILAPDGKTFFHYNLDTLFDVDSGRKLWVASREEAWGPFSRTEGVVSYQPAYALNVHEDWRVDVGQGHEFSTRAIRSFATGRLLFRYWISSTEAEVFNEDATLVYLDEDHSIRPWPPHINYPLLALCQATLALPLLLTWLALRWRRKRRLRIAGAAS